VSGGQCALSLQRHPPGWAIQLGESDHRWPKPADRNDQVNSDAESLRHRPARRRSGHGEVWVAREYAMFVFLRLVVVFALLWAGIGSFLYSYLLDFLGLKWMSLELQWTLFVVLSLMVAVITAGVLVGGFQLLLKIYRGFQQN